MLGFAEVSEIVFNIAYLITIWLLVIRMFQLNRNVAASCVNVAKRLRLGFFLLALGDTGHVGFRVLAYAFGGLETKLGAFSLVGCGALSTAITVTFLYMLIVDAQRLRYNKSIGITYIFLQALAIIRLIIMTFPQNNWSFVVPPWSWSMLRNMPLTLMGVILAIIMLKDAKKNNDKVFKRFSYYIFGSYLFYLPVILFVQKAPMVGMLMIPKTIMYILMAVETYKAFFGANRK